jgi:O-antigen ligase
MQITRPAHTSIGQLSVTALALLATTLCSLWAIEHGITMSVAAILVLALVILLLVRPDAGTLFFLALAYANVPVLLGNRFGGPELVGIAILPLIGFPILVHWMRRRGVVLDFTFLLMLLLGGAMLVSTLIARDPTLALTAAASYVVEGVLIYFLVLNAVRGVGMLRAAIWTFLLVGTLLSSLGLYQELSGHYNAQFGGLAQRNTERMEEGEDTGRDRESVKVQNRAAGPMGGPNRFAQVLLMVLPLAFFRARAERSMLGKALAWACMLVILGGVLITYSRGGFLTLAGLLVLLVFLRYIPVLQVFLGLVVVGGLVALVAPGYIGRLQTFAVVPQLLSDQEVVQGNGAIRGRFTEMWAAAHCFIDHPVLGVGPGQYTPYYSLDYMDNPDAMRAMDKTRRSHCLYAELAAETGTIGLILFLGLVAGTLSRLWNVRRRLLRTDRELADLATAFWFGILAYLGTAVFLQLSYQRYLWMFLALAGAAVQILGARAWELEAERKPKGSTGAPKPGADPQRPPAVLPQSQTTRR